MCLPTQNLEKGDGVGREAMKEVMTLADYQVPLVLRVVNLYFNSLQLCLWTKIMGMVSHA